MTKLTKNYSSLINNLLNVTIQSHSCCNQNKTHWIVATINPILHRPCVHPSTFPNFLIHKFCSSKYREIIIFAHNYFNEQTQTKHLFVLIFFLYIFPFIRIRYFILFAINTHIDCLNNSKCSVRYIFKATKQGALKVTLHHFLLLLPGDVAC